ncbi:MAG: hypothetical protein IPI67_24890 [Myxococcales bacterium]|nr:hypothetical protein [Myxococcales bacterium]
MTATNKTTQPEIPSARRADPKSSPRTEDVLQEQIDRATEALLRGNAGRARELLLAVLDSYPGNTEVRRLLAKLPSDVPPARAPTK